MDGMMIIRYMDFIVGVPRLRLIDRIDWYEIDSLFDKTPEFGNFRVTVET
jgi:hypothetical protein